MDHVYGDKCNMSYVKIIYLFHFLGYFLLLFNISQAREELISIPVSISPIVQRLNIQLSRPTRFFYERNKDFYSKVTVLDVARNEEQPVSELIKKSVRVVFLISASAHVSGTLTRSELAYLEGSSKWSYRISVKQILNESNGKFTNLTDRIEIYKIQELAMKVLERKYGFSINSVLEKTRMNRMKFYAANEEQWIKIVGTINDIVIKNRSDELKLPRCYFAELINKTQDEMEAFTLYEVDTFLNNITKLKEKLPAYNNATLVNFYQTFDMTPSQLAKLSNMQTIFLQKLELKDTIQLFTRTILFKFNFTKIMLPTTTVESENGIICPSQWKMFRDGLVVQAFEKQAREMSISPTTLGIVIRLPFKDVKRLSVLKILHRIETVINPLKEKKRKIEKFTLSMWIEKKIQSTKRLNVKKHNAISLIKRASRLTKRKLKLLYGWTSHDYHFARLFSVKNLGDECSFDVNNKTLLTLAKINIGEFSEEIHCTSLVALRLVWGQASLTDLKELYYPNTTFLLDEPIAVLVSKLTNSSIHISNRVLSRTRVIQWLLEKITPNNLTEMTNYTELDLQEIPLQRIVLMMHELYNAGSFDSLIKVLKPLNYSTKDSTEKFTEEIFIDDKYIGHGKPTAHPRSLSKHQVPETALLMALFIAALLISQPPFW